MCFKKWFDKEEVNEEEVQEVVEEVPVERKPVDELVQAMYDLVNQLTMIVEDNKRMEKQIEGLKADVQGQKEMIDVLEHDKNKEYEANCVAKDQIVDLLNEKAELERRLNEIGKLVKGE